MAWSAASARALLAANPIASVEPTAMRVPNSGEPITEWLKITAVPLLVFLIGVCIWRCIQKILAWRGLTEDGGGSARNEALGEVRSDSLRAISNNEAAEDLETGLELSTLVQIPTSETLAPIPTSEMLAPILTSEGDAVSC